MWFMYNISMNINNKLKKIKTKIFRLISFEVAKNAMNYLMECPQDGSIEVVFRKSTQSKSMMQLGAIFGLWIKHLSETQAQSEDYLHRMLKAKFLARIYCIEPIGDYQEQWVELLAHYQQSGDQERLKVHAKRISLSWASKEQVIQYMTAIEQHYQDYGIPLPVIDKFYKYKK